MVSFRKTWNSKMVKNKMSAVIDGSTDGAEIADKFTRHFQQNWSSHNDNHPESDPGSALMPDIVGVQYDDFALLDVESANICLLDMRKVQIQTEHILYAHPLVIVQLCSLFNLILKHGTVPGLFSTGVIVPVVKDRHADVTAITNCRGITLSPCISKVFEKCILMKFGHLFEFRPYNLAFRKKIIL